MNSPLELTKNLTREELETCLLQTIGKLSTFSPYSHQHPEELVKQVIKEAKDEENEFTRIVQDCMKTMGTSDELIQNDDLSRAYLTIKYNILDPWLESRGVKYE